MKPSSFMDTSIGGKTLKEYMNIIKMPLLALIGLSVVSFLVGLLAYIPGLGFIFAMIGVAVGLVLSLISWVITGYIGYTTVKKYSGDLLSASVAGALAGLIEGLASALLGLISTTLSFGLGGGSVSGVIGMGAGMAMLVISPIVGVIIGAIIALIGGLIAGARTFGPGGPSQQPAKPSA